MVVAEVAVIVVVKFSTGPRPSTSSSSTIPHPPQSTVEVLVTVLGKSVMAEPVKSGAAVSIKLVHAEVATSARMVVVADTLSSDVGVAVEIVAAAFAVTYFVLVVVEQPVTQLMQAPVTVVVVVLGQQWSFSGTVMVVVVWTVQFAVVQVLELNIGHAVLFVRYAERRLQVGLRTTLGT
ncbi:hypothetical protein BP5796_05196 [Coleophoma crateriformis]|uniref:Uncharacterized protein n=1 Tax=Coleophoma crateriformis TaxID=565419 RepID=A0A3D8S2K7_9HELO|nr:hypothetical protein BP5796_05196 [Coleophoma crateriformis]